MYFKHQQPGTDWSRAESAIRTSLHHSDSIIMPAEERQNNPNNELRSTQLLKQNKSRSSSQLQQCVRPFNEPTDVQFNAGQHRTHAGLAFVLFRRRVLNRCHHHRLGLVTHTTTSGSRLQHLTGGRCRTWTRHARKTRWRQRWHCLSVYGNWNIMR